VRHLSQVSKACKSRLISGWEARDTGQVSRGSIQDDGDGCHWRDTGQWDDNFRIDWDSGWKTATAFLSASCVPRQKSPSKHVTVFKGTDCLLSFVWLTKACVLTSTSWLISGGSYYFLWLACPICVSDNTFASGPIAVFTAKPAKRTKPASHVKHQAGVGLGDSILPLASSSHISVYLSFPSFLNSYCMWPVSIYRIPSICLCSNRISPSCTLCFLHYHNLDSSSDIIQSNGFSKLPHLVPSPCHRNH
jgi:hypothetical protein